MSGLAPRPAATLLLLRDDPFQVLMVRRHASASFASALVFPGGAVDADDASPDWLPYLTGADGLTPDARARRIAALRETFEEVGILVGSAAPPAPTPHARPAAFRALVAQLGLRLPLDALHLFGHWIAPVVAPKRYDTHFYLCAHPAAQVPACDGREIIDWHWIAPADALARAAAGDRSFVFPTRMNLSRLAESSDTGAALAAARNRAVVTVQPVLHQTPHGPRLIIPADAGYGVTEAPEQ